MSFCGFRAASDTFILLLLQFGPGVFPPSRLQIKVFRLTKTDWPKAPLTTVDLQMLHGLLVDWCHNNDCDPDSDRGQVAARALVDWHEFAIHDAAELAKLMRDEDLATRT